MIQPRVLITGASGQLGLRVAGKLAGMGATVTGLGRNAAPEHFPGWWTVCDLCDSHADFGMAEQDVVIHAATDAAHPDNDLRAMENLIAACEEHSNLHLIYVSISGIDSAADHNPYFAMKLTNERLLRRSGLRHTIVRISQFYTFVIYLLSKLQRGPFVLCPPAILQPVDVDFAASELAAIAAMPACNQVLNIHGPEALRFKDLARPWLESRHVHRIVVDSPPFGIMRSFVQLDPVEGIAGGRRWQDWLRSNSCPA